MKASKYEMFYDDSSSDDDEIILNQGSISSIHEVMENTPSFNDDIEIENLEFSLLAYEFGLRVLKSKEVSEYYKPLKEKFFGKNKVLSSESLKEVINTSINLAFKQTYTKHSEGIIKDNKDNINNFIEQSLKDKRAFLKEFAFIRLNNASKEEMMRATEKSFLKQFNLPSVSTDFRTKTLFGNFRNIFNERIKAANKSKVMRQALPNRFSYTQAEGNDTITSFLTYIRLITRSYRRVFKNAGENNDFFDPSDTLSRGFKFSGVDSGFEVNDKHTINRQSLTRTDYVDDMHKYEDIAKRFETLKAKLKTNDSELASLILATLNGKLSENLRAFNLSDNYQADLEKFFSKITYMMFGTEVMRNPSSLILNMMMVELVNKGALSWKKALIDVMPMAPNRAVAAARYIHNNYKTSFIYYYDKTVNADKNIEKATSSKVTDLINREGNLFHEWLISRDINENTNNYKERAIKELTSACKEWFKINITTLQMLKDSLAEELELDSEDFNGLSKRQLLKLLSISDNYSDELKALYQACATFETILSLYRESQHKFVTLGRSEVCNLVDKEYGIHNNITFDDICYLYDNSDEDKFDSIIDDENNLIEIYGLKELSKLYDGQERYKKSKGYHGGLNPSYILQMIYDDYKEEQAPEYSRGSSSSNSSRYSPQPSFCGSEDEVDLDSQTSRSSQSEEESSQEEELSSDGYSSEEDEDDINTRLDKLSINNPSKPSTSLKWATRVQQEHIEHYRSY